jgi:dipeptidase
MCDTIAATGSATADGITLFGKNSDREPNEAQNLCHIPGQRHDLGARVKCTYISIPQAAKTNAILLSKPFWMWGAEMGVNEHGLRIFPLHDAIRIFCTQNSARVNIAGQGR